jgi:hypothetical protein
MHLNLIMRDQREQTVTDEQTCISEKMFIFSLLSQHDYTCLNTHASLETTLSVQFLVLHPMVKTSCFYLRPAQTQASLYEPNIGRTYERRAYGIFKYLMNKC